MDVTPVETIRKLPIGNHWLYGLNPCPCCGGEARLTNTICEAAVFCTRCRLKVVRQHAGGPIMAREDTGIHEAIMAWQARATTAPRGTDNEVRMT